MTINLKARGSREKIISIWLPPLPLASPLPSALPYNYSPGTENQAIRDITAILSKATTSTKRIFPKPFLSLEQSKRFVVEGL